MKSICVFCASSLGSDTRYAEAAAMVGRLIAARGATLVYGGANVGLMGVLADAVLKAGGRAVGVIPRGLEEREVAHQGLSELVVTGSMHERKQKMHDLSDAFLTLPGGFGTMDELFETLTWAQLGIHHKPIGVLDVAGFYAPLIELVDHQLAAGLLREEYRRMLILDSDAERLLDRLLA